MAEMKHMANKQMERHMNKMAAPTEKDMMHHGEGGGEHESFHVSHHPEHGTHSTHTHAGGIDHAEHASPEEAMEHGKMAMGGGGEQPPMEPAAPAAEGGDEGWG